MPALSPSTLETNKCAIVLLAYAEGEARKNPLCSGSLLVYLEISKAEEEVKIGGGWSLF